MAYRQHGLGEAAKATDLDLSGNMKRDPMILEVVERLSNRQLAQELKLIYRTFDEDPQVASQAMKELSEAVQSQQLPFFDRATKALNRTVFSVPDNAKIAMQQKQTGITSGPFLPKEADGIFQQTLNDHEVVLLLLKPFMQPGPEVSAWSYGPSCYYGRSRHGYFQD